MTSDIAEQAERAYNLYVHGLRDGQWQGFRDLLGDEVDLVWPYPPGAGQYCGVDGRQKLLVFLDELGDQQHQIVENELVQKIVCQDRVIFEDRNRGVLFNQPYQGRHCIIIVMRDERLVTFHKYTAQMS